MSTDEAAVVKELLMAYQSAEPQNKETEESSPVTQVDESTQTTPGVVDETDLQTRSAVVVTRVSSGLTQKIASLSGIENFTNLETLDFSGHGISEVDLSENTKLTSLNCSNNQLAALDLSQQPALTTLNCSGNKLSGSLDVSANTQLVTLDCSTNEITALDLSANTALETLNCSTNKLSGDLNVTACPKVSEINCTGNEELSQLVLPDNQETPAEVTVDETTSVVTGESLGPVIFEDENLAAYVLEKYDADDDGQISPEEALSVTKIDMYGSTSISEISSLKGIERFISLDTLRIVYPVKQAVIDLTPLTKLQVLTLNVVLENADDPAQIDLSANTALQNLSLAGNFPDLDLSHNTDLAALSLTNSSKVSELDLRTLTVLKSIIIHSKAPEKLYLSSATEKVDWMINENVVDLSQFSQVKEMSFRMCPNLVSPDFSQCSALQSLRVSSCAKVESLDLSACTALESVTISSCDALQTITLPKGSQAQVSADKEVTILGRGGVEIQEADLKAYLLGLCYSNGDGEISEEEALTVKEIQYYVPLSEPNTPPYSLKGLEYFTNTEVLDLMPKVGNPYIADLDLSKMLRLKKLSLSGFYNISPAADIRRTLPAPRRLFLHIV